MNKREFVMRFFINRKIEPTEQAIKYAIKVWTAIDEAIPEDEPESISYVKNAQPQDLEDIKSLEKTLDDMITNP